MKHLFFLLSLIVFLAGCGPSKFVEPLAHKQLAVGTHFGGPTINYGAPIPIPLTAVEAGYGVDTNLTVYSSLHTTSILFGNLQMDMGATYKCLSQEKYRPNISVTPGFNFIYSFSNQIGKFWPTLDINAYWNYGERQNYFYAGVNNYFELSKTMANNQPQRSHWLFSPQIGHVLKNKKGTGQFTAEIKWLGPNFRNDYAFIPYSEITGNRGATGVFIGYRWLLKRNKQ